MQSSLRLLNRTNPKIMNKYLLDTSTLSLWMKNSRNVKRRLNSLSGSDYPFTCPIAKGEILVGILRLPAGRKQQYLYQRANELFARIPCDPISDNVSLAYAEIKVILQRKGTPYRRTRPLDRCDCPNP